MYTFTYIHIFLLPEQPSSLQTSSDSFRSASILQSSTCPPYTYMYIYIYIYIHIYIYIYIYIYILSEKPSSLQTSRDSFRSASIWHSSTCPPKHASSSGVSPSPLGAPLTQPAAMSFWASSSAPAWAAWCSGRLPAPALERCLESTTGTEPSNRGELYSNRLWLAHRVNPSYL